MNKLGKIMKLHINEIEQLKNGLKAHIENELIVNGFAEYYAPLTEKITDAIINALLEEKGNKKTVEINDEEYVLSVFEQNMEEHIDVALNRKIHTTTLERIRDYAMDYFKSIATEQSSIKKVNKKF